MFLTKAFTSLSSSVSQSVTSLQETVGSVTESVGNVRETVGAKVGESIWVRMGISEVTTHGAKQQ